MKFINTLKLCTALVLTMVISTGCGTATNTESSKDKDKKITVYTSFYTMYDFTNKIGGDKIKLVNLVPSGVEPHEWEPSPKDIAKLEKADLIIYNGAGLEHWVDKVIKSSSGKMNTAVETSKKVKLLDNKNKDSELKYDPHVWLNPQNAKIQMEAIKDAIISVDAANKEYYENNFQTVSRQLDELDRLYKDTISKCSKRDIIVAHQAFGYLCGAYGLNQIAIEGLQAESEPTPAKMAEIGNIAKEKNLKVIFYEELISPKVAQTIAKEVGARTDVLNPLEGLTDDDIKAGKEYFAVMKENLEALKKALE